MSYKVVVYPKIKNEEQYDDAEKCKKYKEVCESIVDQINLHVSSVFACKIVVDYDNNQQIKD